ncbi:MAG: polyribonucleotide nucleotidyltransferase [Candidatus Omnitrophica bacterium CG11_big_fil_rev_8_21_14_0_20_63_9]|nr:MAG: polyribonucleotide nucleotidyltransferase [Candidatus Omnitrophica bacterium CG11_big_fil_rev_8_21_14_0_20_63_9]
MSTRVSTTIGQSTLSLETGTWAKQADGSVVVQQGDTVVLVTAVSSSTVSTRADIVPLTCDYREKTYAAGKIPGGFFKREGRPTEKEILTSRLMDRPIRPLFPKGFLHELQIMASVLSSDGEHDPDVLAVLGASAALRLSSIPFPEILGTVRVGLAGQEFVLNPTYQQLAQSAIDLVVCGTNRGITMIEAGLKEVPEQQLVEAIAFGYQQLKTLIAMQEELGAKAGRPKGTHFQIRKPSTELVEKVRALAVPELKKINEPKKKHARHDDLAALQTRLVEQLTADGTVSAEEVAQALEFIDWQEARRTILERKSRMDGRGYTDLREIACQVGVLPRTHGSGLFTRGETQSLSVTTLGTSDDEQLIESLEGETYKRFMLHYNFPPFSVNEVRPIRGTGRREIGHGALAERAIESMIPSKDEFPYTIRVVSDILESNGSSSMATVCAGALSLMDAGVPIKAPVSGVAMGLVKESSGTAILTDISGLEDHVGDMDFKVAGTRLGTTAMQVDVKLSEGLTVDLISKILAQSHPARMKVLDLMTAAIGQPRTQLSLYAPRITVLKINPEKIRDVIGPGGRTIRKIIEETGATIDIEDDGSVSVASNDAGKSQRALEIIRTLTEDVEVGKIYNAKVKRIMNFGAFCEISPGKEGLVHVSELSDKYVNKVEDVVKIGDEFKVKVIEIDEQGRVNLSRKRLLEGADSKGDGKSERPERSSERRERSERPDR